MDELRFVESHWLPMKGPQYIFTATVNLIPANLHCDVREWCEANLLGKWDTHGAGCFYMYDEADAFQFKLRWV